MWRVEGTVYRLRCVACGAVFPTFKFSGDTDMVTTGLVAATALDTGALALGAVTGEEFSAGYEDALRLFAERVSGELGHRMFVPVVARYEDHSTKSKGEAFGEFSVRYAPPEAVYVCPTCGGDARVQEEMSPATFQRSGGNLILLGNLTL